MQQNSRTEQTTCKLCGELPERLTDPHGALFASRLPGTLPELEQVLGKAGLESSSPLDGTLAFHAAPEEIADALTGWTERLSTPEQDEVRGVLLTGSELDSGDFEAALLNLTGLDAVEAQVNERWLVDLLLEERLTVHFHPVVELSSGEPCAWECLMRGRRNGETVGAWPVISAARRMGLSHYLDRASRRAALREGKHLLKDGHKLFINFNPASICNPEYCLDGLTAACDELGIDPADLAFEVIESERDTDVEHLRAIFQKYRELGTLTSLDDLGSGYLTVDLLARLRPDIAKIDQELVTGAFEDENSGILIGALVKAAHDLDITIVAEGVETAEDLHYCAKLGVDFAQGYFFARPANPAPNLRPEAERALAELTPARSS